MATRDNQLPSSGENSDASLSSSQDGDDSLEYLTIGSMQWSKGYRRPRISAEERRERHRLVQQRFRDRKRQRVRALRVEQNGVELQLRLLQAHAEAQRLRRENEEMRRQILTNQADTTLRDDIRNSRASWAGEDLQALLDVLDTLTEPPEIM